MRVARVCQRQLKPVVGLIRQKLDRAYSTTLPVVTKDQMSLTKPRDALHHGEQIRWTLSVMNLRSN